MSDDVTETILFVDDEQENLNLYRNLLKRSYRVLTARDGEEALAVLRREPVAVVLCDQRMPGMSGIEVLARAKDLRGDTARVLITAYPDLEVAVEAINRGQVRRYLAKPLEPEELRAVVRQEVDYFRLVRHNRRLMAEMARKNETLSELNEELSRSNAELSELSHRIQQKNSELAGACRELQRLDNVKSELLSNVSHELRTPLVSIRGYTDLINEGKLGEVSEPQRRAMAVIRRSVDRLVGLIEELLDFSRLAQGREELSFELLDLVKVLAETVETLQTRAAEAGVELSLQAGEDALLIQGDRGRLEQIFTNLIENGIKFNGHGGQVRVSVESTPGRRVEVTVADDGPGIASDHLPLIFERFYQVDGSTTRRHGGAGIGLSLARELVRMHGGTVRVRSELGRGTEFVVDLPVSRVRPEEPAGRLLDAGPRLLLELSRETGTFQELANALTASGCRVRQAGGPAAACKLAREGGLDVVSVVLTADAEEDGFDLLARLTRNAPVRAERGQGDVLLLVEVERLQRAGGPDPDVFLVKPVGRSPLLQGVRKAMERAQTLGLNRTLLLAPSQPPYPLISMLEASTELQVEAVHNVDALVTALRRQRTGLVVVDLDLGVELWSVIQAVRRRWRGQPPAVLALGTLPSEQLSFHCGAYLVGELLHTPLEPRPLAERLCRRLGVEPSAAEAGPAPPPRRRVLVVDDDADVLSYITDLLGLEGLQVRCAGSGADALELAAASDEIGLVLLDLAMPEPNGLEVCRLLRADPRTEALPIYIVTAKAGLNTSAEAAQAGANGCLVKPFDNAEFTALVRRHLA